MAMGFVGLIFIVIALLIVGGLIAGIVMWSTAGTGGNQMACGSCGYAVKGLTQLNCPECGADLREAGIGRTGSPGKRTAGMVLTIVCGLFVLLGCGMSGLILFGFKSSQSVSMPAYQTMPAPSGSSGSTIYTNPDGSTTIQDPDGTITIHHPDGSITTTSPDGKTTHFDENGIEVVTPEPE